MATKGSGAAKKKAMGLRKATEETIDAIGMVLESRIDDVLESMMDTVGLATKADLLSAEKRLSALEKKLGKKPAGKKKTAKKATRKKKAKKKKAAKRAGTKK
ncbi:MAG: hypothetical protein L6427_08610 [Actinomycetia bacterium]|nr:hypothetical protein [Actinomycetes bacterium]